MSDRLSEVWGAFLPVPAVIVFDERATRAHCLVIGSLAYCLTPKTAGRVFQRRIAERAHVSRRVTQQCLADLEVWGYIVRRHRPGLADHYRLQRLRAAAEQIPGLEAVEVALPTSPARRTSPPNDTNRRPTGDLTGHLRARSPENPLSEKQGDEENEQPPAWPSEGIGRRFDPHAWDNITPLSDVLDEILEGDDE